jgi:hypothetical protein
VFLTVCKFLSYSTIDQSIKFDLLNMHKSIFSYTLSRPYPYRWFTWVAFVGGVLASFCGDGKGCFRGGKLDRSWKYFTLDQPYRTAVSYSPWFHGQGILVGLSCQVPVARPCSKNDEGDLHPLYMCMMNQARALAKLEPIELEAIAETVPDETRWCL